MLHRFSRYLFLGLLAVMGALILGLMTAAPSLAHWADMAAAEIIVQEREVQVTLTFPTGLTSFADEDGNGQLTVTEVQRHREPLQTFLAEKIRVYNSANQVGSLQVAPIDRAAIPPAGQSAPDTHSTLKLTYSWPQPVQGLTIRYQLFLPGVSTASCLATILQAGQLKTFVFTPQGQILALAPPGLLTGGLWLGVVGAFGWGALHSLSPGHGKTIVAAYLVGERATAHHALFLAAVTTITHTLGVFALGLVTLFAVQYIETAQIHQWMSLMSGLLVVTIGIQLLRSRLRVNSAQKASHIHQNSSHEHHLNDYQLDSHFRPSHAYTDSLESCLSEDRADSQACRVQAQLSRIDSHPEHLLSTHDQGNSCVHQFHHSNFHHSDHPHPHPHSNHDHPHHHSNHHHHDHHHHHSDHHHFDHYHHSRDHHSHSHFPPGADGTSVTWRSLLALGISGGLIPCPAALVLLLSCIALGNSSLGLMLVLAFSLGLACVLTILGLALVYAKQWFQTLPVSLRPTRFLPILSASTITLIGLGISVRAFIQVFGAA